MDPPELNKQFSDLNKYNFPLLSDPTKETAKAYGVLAANGAFAQRWTYYIDDQSVVRFIDKGVQARQHGTDVAKKLAALNVPKK